MKGEATDSLVRDWNLELRALQYVRIGHVRYHLIA